MKKRFLFAVGVIVLMAGSVCLSAQEGPVALQFSMGTQGSLSFFEAGVVFPSLGESVFVGLKARIMSSLTRATSIHRNGASVSFHPVVACCVDSSGGFKSLLCDRSNMYALASSWPGRA